MTLADAFNELCYYTLAHGEPSFVHQHVVDACTAQNADVETKPIALTFALIGLYLHIERHFTGKQVQQVHMRLARRKRSWPSFMLPSERGTMTVNDVLGAAAGPERDKAIHAWCVSVWEAFRDSRETIENLLQQSEII